MMVQAFRPEELERVFEPFYRVEASRNRDTGGTGLGLSIARDIAQAHGGSIALRNRAEGGLEAIVTLPRSDPHTPSSRSESDFTQSAQRPQSQ